MTKGTITGTLTRTVILELGTRAVLDGKVVATSGAGDALVLAPGGAGTLAGLGTTVFGFDTITVAARANWTLSGASTLTATENLRDNATLTLGGALAGAGTITLDAGSTLTATAGVSGAGLAFNGAATLVLDSIASVTSTLSGFAHGDTIDLAKLAVTSISFANGTLHLEDGTLPVGTLAFSGSFTQNNFAFGTDCHGGTDIVFLATQEPTPDRVTLIGLPEHDAGMWHCFMLDIFK